MKRRVTQSSIGGELRRILGLASDGIDLFGEIVDQPGAVTCSMTFEDQRLAIPPDPVQFVMSVFAEEIPHTILQVSAAHREIMNSGHKTELAQRLLDENIGDEKSAGGGNFKMLGDGILKNQAIGKGGSVLPNPSGKSASDPAVVPVIVLAVITGMRQANDPFEAAFP
jgi:hypothetical protein